MTNTTNNGNPLTPLGFDVLRKANMKRIPTFKNRRGEFCHNEDGSDWSPAQWLQAVLGELGEYANFRKKFERGDFDEEEFKKEAGKELADVITYLDILSFRLGIDLGQAVLNKFNEISHRVESPIFIGQQYRTREQNYIPFYIIDLRENITL
jgi:NTP pyrophosphatase (non-canonical NTP hydrolase)